MKRIITSTVLAVTFLFTATISKAQTAMNFSKADCNGTMHDCFADLDAGKAVILHFYMPPPCSSCPPPAQKIQMMANNILATHPGLITAYAFPYNNTTSCSISQSWVNNNGLSLYSPMDSGATLVANYGGFGMPTVVLLGGTDHRIMFSTLSFTTNDTTTMRDSILALLTPAAINDLPNNISALDIYPNPANEQLTLKIDAKESMSLNAEILDMMGHQVALLANEKSIKNNFTKSFNTSSLANGFYILKIKVGENIINRKVNVTH
jgi:hypothetical protein